MTELAEKVRWRPRWAVVASAVGAALACGWLGWIAWLFVSYWGGPWTGVALLLYSTPILSAGVGLALLVMFLIRGGQGTFGVGLLLVGLAAAIQVGLLWPF